MIVTTRRNSTAAAHAAVLCLISTRLYGVTSTDPLTVAAVALLMFGVATIATLVPAYRASRIDPTAALRYE